MTPSTTVQPKAESSPRLSDFRLKLFRSLLLPINLREDPDEFRRQTEPGKVERPLFHRQFLFNLPPVEIDEIHPIQIPGLVPGELHVLVSQITMIKARIVHALHRKANLLQQGDQDVTVARPDR